jgi:tetraacyldisaccharide 4'-kinase
LDDGFQHIRLHRNFDVVNINSTSPFGPGGLIPKGTLREPPEHLKRASAFVLTKSNIGSKNLHWIRQRLLEIKPEAVIFEAVHRPVQFMDFKRNRFVPLETAKGKKVATISGIGDPYSFEKTVESLGAEILLAARFDDHHAYTVQELKDFTRRLKEVGAKEVVTTEKDFYRMEALLKGRKGQDSNLFNPLVLQIEFELNDEEDFLRRCLDS